MSAYARVAWAMLRGPVLHLLALYAVSGLAVAGSVSAGDLGRVALVLVPFLVFSAVVNDLADARIDAVNLPGDAKRVLAGGRAHRRQLRLVATLALVVAIAAAACLGPVALAVTGAGVAVATAYSVGPVRLADRGVVAALVLPACYVAVPYLLGVLAGRGVVRAADLPLLAALYVGFLGRIVLKDFRDVRGDTLFGKRTFLVRHGRVATCRFSAACWVLATALAVVTSPHRTLTMVAGSVAATALALWLLRLLGADPGHRTEERIVSALAIVGRGAVLVVVAPVAAAAAGGPAWVGAVVTLGAASVSVAQAIEMWRHGPSRGTRTVATQWHVRAVAEQPAR